MIKKITTVSGSSPTADRIKNVVNELSPVCGLSRGGTEGSIGGAVGNWVGCRVEVGCGVGFGCRVGSIVGIGVGVGSAVGIGVGFGSAVGSIVGIGVGVGSAVGSGVGVGVGSGVGSGVGVGGSGGRGGDSGFTVKLTVKDSEIPFSALYTVTIAVYVPAGRPEFGATVKVVVSPEAILVRKFVESVKAPGYPPDNVIVKFPVKPAPVLVTSTVCCACGP